MEIITAVRWITLVLKDLLTRLQIKRPRYRSGSNQTRARAAIQFIRKKHQ